VSDTNGYVGSFGYDALGRQTSAGNSWLGTKSSAYDLAGRRTRLTHRDGFFVDYDYLVTGEMTRIREIRVTSWPPSRGGRSRAGGAGALFKSYFSAS
jgi:YD repeat-containing protein